VADFLDHIKQAEHNEELAELLLRQHSQFLDWIITVSFYAAIHYVEAGFNQDPNIRHTETCKGIGGTLHDRRQKLVSNKYGRECWKHYRNLRNASHNVRYLLGGKVGTATDYYKVADAANFLKNDLQVIKQYVNV